MKYPHAKTYLGVAAAVIVAGAIPVLFYWHLFMSVPAVSVQQARAMLEKTNAGCVLVDVRPHEAYDNNNITGTVNWEFKAIVSLPKPVVHGELEEKQPLLLICDTGL